MASEGGGGVGAVLLAAGASRRMGGVDKVWAELGGRPLLAWPLERLAAVRGVEEIVVVAASERHREIAALASGVAGEVEVRCVEGGERRRDSVAAGLGALSGTRGNLAGPEVEWVLVHDAARPLASRALAERVLAAAREAGAAVPGLAVSDTIKVVDGAGLVRETLERSSLRAVQTPQAFSAALLRRAHAEVEGDASDDAWLVERLGAAVRVVEGETQALKVTAAQDLERLRALLAAGEGAAGEDAG